MPSLRTQNRGTERPSSESLKTQESLKQDQLRHKCLRQIEDHKELPQDSFNFLVELLRNDSLTGLPIQPSNNVDTKPFDYAISDFLAPLYHHKTDQWAVLYVSFQYLRKENRGKGVITAQHYDLDPRRRQGRHTEVGGKIRSWVKQRPGSNVELRFTREVGPTVPQSSQNVTGMYAVMGAMDFSARRSIQSKDKFWSGDRVETIKTALQATRSRHPTPGVTPGRRGSSVCSTGNGAEDMRTPARTPKNGARIGLELPSYDKLDAFQTQTPGTENPKRQRTDSAEPVAFDNKKDELEECQAERASRAREHEECEKACIELDIKINDDEHRVKKWLSEFPQSLKFAIDTEQTASWKRKAGESLDFANQVFSELEGVVDRVSEEGKVLEEWVKMAYMRKEFVEMKERHLEDHQALLWRFEGDDWEKQFDKGPGNM
ncbi:hypothetical protein FACUT_5510 [Fusarium acutatum]|uniref:Uncharacterized protein n=1 Tax=Fusarium acutatum TaxID=78861 RepID=A0A8H4JV15_9HYPO|nr:hypothetical protein FACUT_5510 [Fusarium acutatum]